MSGLVARPLTGGRVACAQPSCQRPLPGVLRFEEPAAGGRQGDRELILGQGWQADDNGVWGLTANARADAEFMAGRHGDARRHNRGHHTEPARETVLGWVPDLPARVVCPHCGAPQWLRSRRLGVVVARHTLRRACAEPGCPHLFEDRHNWCAEHRGAHRGWADLGRERGIRSDWLVPD